MGVYGKILVHHGIQGQKWGVRRFQNKDGSLTPQGRKRLEKAYKGSAWERSDKEYYKYQDNYKVQTTGNTEYPCKGHTYFGKDCKQTDNYPK